MSRAAVGRGDGAKRPINIAHIAESAGVSKMTVSRVINGAPGVGDETRKRVQQILDDLDFVPNVSARALATGGGRTIGFVSMTSEISGPVIQTLVSFQRAANAAGFRVTIIGLDSVNEETVRDARRQLKSEQVEVVLVTSPLNASRPALQALADEFPAIGLWTPSGPIASVAAPDNERGAALATRHLLDLGHRTVAHVSGPAAWMATDHREFGWRTELQRAGAEVIEPVRGDWRPESGYDAGRALLAAHPEVTAIFVASDAMALGVLRAVKELGLRVPEDVSVVGYDDTAESAFFEPPLTTVRQHYGELGVRAFNAAMERIGEPDLVQRIDASAPTLVARATTSSHA